MMFCRAGYVEECDQGRAGHTHHVCCVLWGLWWEVSWKGSGQDAGRTTTSSEEGAEGVGVGVGVGVEFASVCAAEGLGRVGLSDGALAAPCCWEEGADCT